MAPLSINVLHRSVGEAAGKARIVRVGKVDAAVATARAFGWVFRANTEIHEVMTGESHEARGIISHIPIRVQLLDYASDDLLVI